MNKQYELKFSIASAGNLFYRFPDVEHYHELPVARKDSGWWTIEDPKMKNPGLTFYEFLRPRN